MKSVLKYFVIIFLIGCTHAQKDEDTVQEKPKEAVTSTPMPEPTPVPVAKHSSGSFSEIDDAFRAQNDEALFKASTHALSIDPKNSKALNALGLYYYKKRKVQAAKYFFSRALESAPNSAAVHNNMGLVYLADSDIGFAIREFRKAIELNPSDSAAPMNLGSIYVSEGDYVKGAVVLEMAMKDFSDDYKSRVNYGVAMAGVGKVSQAKGQYQRALKLNSNGKEALFNLALLEIEQLKQYQDGLDLLAKLKFVGVPDVMRSKISNLEAKAKGALK